MSHRNTPSKMKIAPAKRAKLEKASGSSRGGTKQQTVLGLLKQPKGTTIAAIAGVVRKKLGLTLTSKKADGGRIYRVAGGKPTKFKSNPSVPALPAA